MQGKQRLYLPGLAFLLSVAARAATLPAGFTETIFSGFSSPTAMAVAGDGRIFVCQQGGSLRVIKNDVLLPSPVLTLTVDSNGERGLLGVTLDPNFSQNSFLYVYYTSPTPAVHNRLSRFTLSGDVAVSGSEFVLLDLDNLSSATNHNGGALHFGTDGKIYVAVGDNANGSNAQSFTILFGKILRLNSDGTIPPNPFDGQTTGKYKAIWAMGLRNPFTFAIRSGTPGMLINDVGQSTWEEVDVGTGGANYGWPTCEGPFLQGTTNPCNNPSYTDPLYYYGHTGGACAITGGDFYNPEVPGFPNQYLGQYFFGDYCAGWIHRIDPVSALETDFATAISSPVDIQVGYDGGLYYLAYGSGSVARVIYTGSNSPAITQDPSSQLISVGHPVTFTVAATGAPTLMYQWQKNSMNIPGATSPSYTIASVALADSGTQYRCVVSNAFPPPATSAQATLTVTTDQPPTPTITAPVSGTTYAGGNTITFAGTATDPEDGTLPASAFTWWVNFHHDAHFHPFLPPTTGITGGTFVIPTLGETSPNVFYRIHLSVIDSGGLVSETTRDILPKLSTMTFTTVPGGLQLTLDGQPITAPSSVVGVEGITRTIGAPSPQSGHVFVSWSDGGAQTHDISTPVSDTTYTATFTGGASPTPTPSRTQTPTPTRTPTPGGGGLPPPWVNQDIGGPGIAGSASFSSGTFTVKGSGADIAQTSDQFQYVYQPLNGDGTIIARVASIQNTNPWAKAGVMIRETLTPTSVFAMTVLTPGNGVAFQRRVTVGSWAKSTPGALVAAPYWVKLVRSGNTFTGYNSANGTTWTLVGSDTISMATNVYVGLPVTSHNNAVLCTATLDNVSLTGTTPTPTPTRTPTLTPTRTPTPGGGGLPPPWVHQDIGGPGVAGSASYSSGTFTVKGSGTDIAQTTDQFQYVYQPLSGNGTIIARVASIQNTNPWAKAGVMIRETLTPTSVFAMTVLTPGNGVAFQRRVTVGSWAKSTPGALVAAPYWVKLVRSGNTFTGYNSANGTTWTLVGSDTISMATNVYVGLPVTSHNNAVLCTATLDSVTVSSP